jgi:hypothetical protein
MLLKIIALTFVIMLIVISIMAIGIFFQRKPIKGSCGGVSNIPGVKSACECNKPCKNKQRNQAT